MNIKNYHISNQIDGKNVQIEYNKPINSVKFICVKENCSNIGNYDIVFIIFIYY